MSREIHRNRATKRLELQFKPRKGLHLYHYFLDPLFGFMHARIQTWFPFSARVCRNGRAWLAQRMDAVGRRVSALNLLFSPRFFRPETGKHGEEEEEEEEEEKK